MELWRTRGFTMLKKGRLALETNAACVLLVLIACVAAPGQQPPVRAAFHGGRVPDSVAIWWTTESVSSESMSGAYNPSMAVDGAGNVHVVWYDDTNFNSSGAERNIVYKMQNATTGAWGAIHIVSTESTNSTYAPTIAMDGDGNVHVAWQDTTDYGGSGTDYDIFYKVRNVTTGTWSTTQVVSTESSRESANPSLAIDGAGNVHVAWYDYTDYSGSGTDVDIFYKVRNATTGTWCMTQVISTESTNFSCNPSLAVGPAGNVHVVWQEMPNLNGTAADYDIYYKVWNATTGVWGMAQHVSTESTNITYAPSMAVDGAGNVHVAWMDRTDYGGGSDADYKIVYKVRNATTGAWGTIQVISSESMNATYDPALVVDGAGNVHVAWQDDPDYAGPGSNSHIVYRMKNVTTGAWGTTQVVSTEGWGSSWLPSLVVDGEGEVHVAWQQITEISDTSTNWRIFYKREAANRPPQLTGLADVTFVHGRSAPVITWTIVDSSAGSGTYLLFRNGTVLASGVWTSMATISRNLADLKVGSYNFTILASDGLNSSAQDTVLILIMEDTSFVVGIVIGIGASIGIVAAAIVLRLKYKRIDARKRSPGKVNEIVYRRADDK